MRTPRLSAAVLALLFMPMPCHGEKVVKSREGATEKAVDRGPKVRALSAIVVNANTGEVLFEKNANIPLPVASTQKLLAALVAIRAGQLEKKVIITASDTRVLPRKIGLRAGDSYTRQELLEMMLIVSANDAASALGRDLFGSEPQYARAMTQLARKLGAKNSLFKNPHGLPAPQHSTARDMALLAGAAYQEPLIRKIVAQSDLFFRSPDGMAHSMPNGNPLIRHYGHYTGMKPGYTLDAGKCLVASAAIDGKLYIIVQLASDAHHIFADTHRLLEWSLKVEKRTAQQKRENIALTFAQDSLFIHDVR